MHFPISLTGPSQYGIRSALDACSAVPEVWARRLLRGPRRPGWNWYVELGTEILKKEVAAAHALGDVAAARRYLDSFVVTSRATSQVNVTQVAAKNYKASWFVPKKGVGDQILLYFHGGGYSFYPRAYTGFISAVALATESKTLAVDYRLSPEHCFPAQLEDALHAYRGLLANDINASRVIVGGDSAGGNLAIALLLAVRDSNLPQPALTIALSPAVDFQNECPSVIRNAPFDWIQRPMLLQWAEWFCGSSDRQNPLISPLFADLRSLAPIYIQAGGCEVLIDAIQELADRAKKQAADVRLEIWDDMNHDFQLFGRYAPQSLEAVRRLGHVIKTTARGAERDQHKERDFAR